PYPTLFRSIYAQAIARHRCHGCVSGLDERSAPASPTIAGGARTHGQSIGNGRGHRPSAGFRFRGVVIRRTLRAAILAAVARTVTAGGTDERDLSGSA